MCMNKQTHILRDIHIHTYLHTQSLPPHTHKHRVMLMALGNRIGGKSSNWGRGCLRLTSH